MTERGDTPEPAAPEDPAGPPDAASPAAPEAAGPVPAAPVVAWEAPAPAYAPPPGETGAGTYAGDPPPFTIGAILSDTFARYGADPIRFFLIALSASVLSLLGTFLSMPFGSGGFGAGADSGGLVGLLSFVVGLIAGSATFALAEGGPSMPSGRVLRRGVERAGWMFLTSLLLAAAFIVVFLIAAIPLLLFALISPWLTALLLLVLLPVLVWLGLRVTLALPATVVDNLNSIDGLKVSWRATRPSGIWLRVLGASFLLGLLAIPMAIGAAMLLLLALLGGQPALLFVTSLVFAFVTPLTSLVTYSAYRRLVPPFQPSWATPQLVPVVAIDAARAVPVPAGEAALETAAPSVETAAPPAWTPTRQPGGEPAAPPIDAPGGPPPGRAFSVPPFAAAARAILGIVIALDVAGILAIPFVAGEIAAGRVTFPRFPTSPDGPFPVVPGFQDFVVTGTVAFGTSADLGTCTVQGQASVLPSSGPIVWVAAFEDRVRADDEVFVRVSRDGEEIESSLQEPGAYDCLGTEEPQVGAIPGEYLYQVIVNGQVEATGTLLVQ